MREGTEHQIRLWRRLCEFRFDDGAAEFGFVARLARDNGWSPGLAERAVDEYRRFLFLAVEAGHPVTPSDEVDQVWHLHLCYTRSYWQQLCGEVLGRPLHHGPTRGGAAEDAKYGDWYRRTLSSYRRFFGPPPPDLWPAPEVRFAPRRLQRIDLSRSLIVPRAPLLAASSLLLLVVAAGCARGAVDDAVGVVLAILGVVAFVVVVFLLAATSGGGDRMRGGGRCGGGCGGGCGGDGCGGDGCGGDGCGGGGCGGGGCGGD